MDDWKERLKAEYAQLKEWLKKLHKFNVKQEIAFRTYKCKPDDIEEGLNRDLCRDQEETMTRYLLILELRAETYGIELKGE